MDKRLTGRPMPKAIGWMVGALLSLALVFAVTGGHSGHARPSTSPAAPGSVRVDTAPPSTRHATERGLGRKPPAAMQPLLGPGDDRTVEVLFARLAPLSGEGDVAAALLMRQAAAVCRHAVEPGWQSRTSNPRAMAYAAWKASFCTRTVSQAELDSISQQGRLAFDRRHPGWAATGPRSVDEVFDAVTSSDDVEITDMASVLLPRDATDHWDLGRDLVQGSAYEADLHKYQHVALDDMQCATTGGCEPGGMRSAMICLMSDGYACAPGQGAYDMWNEQLSPAEIDIVLGIEQRIRDERHRRAATPPG